MSQKKLVGRSIAIGLGIVCIILVAGIGGVMAYYTMQLNSKDSSYNDYISTHHHTDSEYNALQNQVNDLTSSLSMGNSKVWIGSQTVSSPFNAYYSWVPLRVDYAGYVSVNVESSTSTYTYVHAIYSAYGVNYDNSINVGSSGTAIFPVLPTSSLGIYVGAYWGTSTVTVTITYYY